MPPESGETSDAVYWQIRAELSACVASQLQPVEQRILGAIELHRSEARELERRVRAAEDAITRLKTLGSIAATAVTLLLGWLLTKL